jgi:spore germination cell wall hydrolase CwlJ-like protein
MICNPDCREEKGGVASSTHYHADYVAPGWAKKFERTGSVGRHIFYYSASL